MKSHDTFLELAAAAIDFELSATERSRLEAHLAACAACVREAAALHADARSLATLPAVRLSSRRGDELLATALHPGVVRQPLRLLAVAALVGLLLVGSIAIGAELLRRAQRDELSVLPVPSASVNPDASPVADNGVGMRWERVEIPESEVTQPGGATMGGVIAGGPGAIAWGFVYGSDPRIWTTSDGRTWERATVPVPDDADPEYQEPGSVSTIVAGGPGYIAAGHYYRQGTGHRALIWTSVDGRTWELLPHDPVFENAIVYDIITWHGELLAFGNWSYGPSGGATPAKLWASRDGLTWQNEGLSLPAGLTMGFWAATTDRLWAIGGAEGDDTGSQPAVILTSTDGRSWSRSHLPRWNGEVFAVGGTLLMLVPSWPLPAPDFTPPPTPEGQPSPGLYRASGDETWEPISRGLSAAGNDLIEVGGTLILVGDDSAGDPQCQADCQAMGWRSIDGGVTWRAVPADVVGGTMLNVAALPGGRLVAVGRLLDDQASPSPAAWVSEPVLAPAASPEPPADAARIRCEANGTTTLESSVVRPQADGVHIITVNETGQERALDVDGVGGDNAGPGSTETVWAVPPGTMRVACYDSSAGPAPDDAYADLRVVDLDGTYVSIELDCADATVSDGSYPAGAPGLVGDPVDLTLAALAWKYPSLTAEAAGYEANATRLVRVLEAGRPIARFAWVSAGTDTWLLDSVTTCAGKGLAIDFAALARFAAPSPSPAAAPSLGADLTWDRAPDQASLADSGMVAVASGSDRLVAVGCATPGDFVDTGCTGAAWHSTDGLTWTRGTVESADHLYPKWRAGLADRLPRLGL